MVSRILSIQGLLVYLAFVSNTFWATSAVTAAADTQAIRPTLLLVGDSLTELGTDPAVDGWVTLLQYRYTRSADVLVRGLSGYNTRWFVNHVMPALEKEIADGVYTPSLIAVWLGVNDATLTNGSNPEMHVPVENYTANLVDIVSKFQTVASDAEVLLITPPHVDDAIRTRFAEERNDTKHGLVDRSNVMAGDYARACVEAASQADVPVLDLYAHFNAMNESTRNNFLNDGLHFSAAGHKVVDEQFRSKIAVEFPDLVANLKPWQFPASSKWVSEDPYPL
ncbi:hypothetical protein PHYBOEH_004176 [Phytophthora boehmeriae]|uniref:SGNH hydrolase-type esterase domain-containing protein n=1 Tax=Phytophthora boehmeriae TaxID=109152 RepID=A0A8T1WPN5_9STRA|nr:hypothetical protein PHYBOEH_004176 [Phytophthora boehmeriae]